MKLTKQSQSRLEESKVEKRIEDEEYLANHQEIAAAIRVISKVVKWLIRGGESLIFLVSSTRTT